MTRSSTLTQWQRRKLQSLCDERHPILSRRREGKERAADRKLLRHIERQIDWYEMKEAKPGFDAMHARLLESRRLYARARRLAKLAGAHLDPLPPLRR